MRIGRIRDIVSPIRSNIANATSTSPDDGERRGHRDRLEVEGKP